MNLPEQLYLLACDVERGRVPERGKLGRVLRAAALTDLVLRGSLTDDHGRPSVRGVKPTGDQLLDGLCAEISRDKPRKWQAWVQRRPGPALREVQSGLERAGAITVRSRRVLGIFPGTAVTVHDPVAREVLRTRVRAAVQEDGALPPAEAALAALAATGELRTVLTGRERRARKQRIRDLAEVAGPAGPALRKAIEALKAAHAAAHSGGE
ncbi:hypothetical protein JOF53_001393 [Crossiella equi]|uniref:Golgi phosphoprotein 3 (GPP34) n=1 Tax=Crossiella equi TaxID=130796 RepID=A0ABS5A877_9PSEU|nr:GPP34 family phosphoprotein [Crossiella equi]MBP2472521.1 hypothetical protein [Crossiella equi]